MDDVFGHGLDRVRIEDHEVRGHARLDQPAVVDLEGRGRVEGEPVDAHWEYYQ
jgi:hypothetical protein